MTEVTWKDTPTLAEGRHEGTITRTEERTTEQGYKYFDVYFKVKNIDFEPKYSVSISDTITPRTMLGKLLIAFGVEFKPDVKVNIEEILVSKKVSFLTTIDKNGFVRVVENSIKPL